ncbi:hypothetical protein MRX96_044021 [Rhipicephalus microplus]
MRNESSKSKQVTTTNVETESANTDAAKGEKVGGPSRKQPLFPHFCFSFVFVLLVTHRDLPECLHHCGGHVFRLGGLLLLLLPPQPFSAAGSPLRGRAARCGQTSRRFQSDEIRRRDDAREERRASTGWAV